MYLLKRSVFVMSAFSIAYPTIPIAASMSDLSRSFSHKFKACSYAEINKFDMVKSKGRRRVEGELGKELLVDRLCSMYKFTGNISSSTITSQLVKIVNLKGTLPTSKEQARKPASKQASILLVKEGWRVRQIDADVDLQLVP